MEESVGNSDWQTELREMEKIEAMVARFPADTAPNYRELFQNHGISLRIDVIRILDSVDFRYSMCADIISLLSSCEKGSVITVVGILLDHISSLESVLYFLKTLPLKLLGEFLDLSSADQGQLYDMSRFFNKVDLSAVADYMGRLSCSAFMTMLHTCEDNKTMKQCNLCRLRKMRALEDKLNHHELPASAVTVPGAISVYSTKNETWQAPDEQDIKFKVIVDGEDIKESLILYNASTVELLLICDKCLADVYSASTASNKHIEVFHLQPEERQAKMFALRSMEKPLAYLMETLSKERVKRRAKELCGRIIAQWRRGRRLEAEAEERENKAAQDKLAQEKQAALKTKLVSDSYSHWGKWKAESDKMNAQQTALKQSLAHLNYHVEFGNPDAPAYHASPAREHPHSWRPQHYETSTANILIPVTIEAAAELFGTATIQPESQLEQLSEWRADMLKAHHDREEREREKQRLLELERKTLYESRVKYVEDKLHTIEMREYRKRMNAQLEEEQRIERRQREREERRAARIRGYEERERRLMAAEDELSHRTRELYLERQREQRELMNMRKQERVQTLVDGFWGIDLAERLRREEEERRRRAYEALVEDFRVTCVKVKIIRPEEQEVRDRVYRDRITGEVLT